MVTVLVVGTGMESGIAFPRAEHPGVVGASVAAARVAGGVDFGTAGWEGRTAASSSWASSATRAASWSPLVGGTVVSAALVSTPEAVGHSPAEESAVESVSEGMLVGA